MGKVVFLIDDEEGHYLPTFAPANSLSSRGHELVYLGIIDCEKSVRDAGFNFKCLATDIYPAGYKHQRRTRQIEGKPINKLCFFEKLNSELRQFVSEFHPDIFVVSTFLSLDGLLIATALNVKVIIFTPYLLPDSFPRSECWKAITSIFSNKKGNILQKTLSRYNLSADTPQAINDITLLLDQFFEIVACPDDFDPPFNSKRKNRFFIGPLVRERSNSEIVYIPPNKKLIYVSMGSQLARVKEKSIQLYTMLMQLMNDSDMDNYHLILSGGGINDLIPENKMPNVTIMNWAPQVSVLKQAALMINHGGLGTIKECIMMGVPMIVIPDKYDQPQNAQRITHHRLGIHLVFDDISKTTLKQSIKSLIDNSDASDSLRIMKSKFIEKENALKGEMLIEEEMRSLRKINLPGRKWWNNFFRR